MLDRRRVAVLLVASIAFSLPVSVLAQTAELPQAETAVAPPGATSEAGEPDAAAEAMAEGEELGEISVDRESLPHDLSPIGMFLGADHVVKAVIGGLAAASVVTWAIFLSKSIELAGVRRRTNGLRQRIARSESIDDAVETVGRRRDVGARLVRAAAEELDLSRGLPAEGIKERTISRFDRIESGAGRDMARGTAVLASVGSLSPFVGLFGTVWGIMNSFIGISQSNTTNLAIVAPGIAEALFATGIGLVAAIPAVLFYNVFARMIAGNKAAIADVSAETLRLLSRDLDRAATRGSLRLVAAAE